MKNDPQIVRTRKELKKALLIPRRDGQKIGFVPTMGALHDGHISLVTLAKQSSDFTVASIFVNPTQFTAGEDLETYPRTEEADLERLGMAACDLVYIPAVSEMYPDGSLTNVRVEGMSDLLDGVFRPHFFYGVATVVARLFVQVQPDIAVFGEKDYQQLQIIRRMVRDLGMTVEVLGGATVRDADGLAQSSRNVYLTRDERLRANVMSAALHRAAIRIGAGVAVSVALKEARGRIEQAGFDKLDYVSAVNPSNLEDLPDDAVEPEYEGRILAAAWMGKTRLIDNVGFGEA